MTTVERSYVLNGRFEQDLGLWDYSTTGASYLGSDGDAHYGMAVLGVGGWVKQLIQLPSARTYRVHCAVKSAGTVVAGEAVMRLRDGYDNLLVAKDVTVGTADVWGELTWDLGLPSGTVRIEFENLGAGQDVKVDDVWVFPVLYTRAGIVARVASGLAAIAEDLGWSSAVDGDLTEGDYTYGLEAALRKVNAVNPADGTIDLRYLDSFEAAVGALEYEMLKQAHNAYVLQVDIRLGARQENRSQLARAVAERIGVGPNHPGSKGGLVMMPLRFESLEDYPDA